MILRFQYPDPSTRSSLTPPALPVSSLSSRIQVFISPSRFLDSHQGYSPAHAAELRTSERASLSARETLHASCRHRNSPRRLYLAPSSSPVPISSPSPWLRSRSLINFGTGELAHLGRSSHFPYPTLHPTRRRLLKNGLRKTSHKYNLCRVKIVCYSSCAYIILMATRMQASHKYN